MEESRRRPRRRALAALRLEEREEISRGIAAGQSIRQIAYGLERAPSTVSREMRRNGGSQRYRANRADRSAGERALRPKPCRLALHRELRWRVAQKLALQWSPEQISGWLKREFPTDQEMQISHEAIYRSLFVQTRGVLKKELTAHLRTRRQMRLPKSRQRREWTGTHPPDGLHPRAARRGRGSCRAGPLGRKPFYRSERYAHRHTD